VAIESAMIASLASAEVQPWFIGCLGKARVKPNKTAAPGQRAGGIDGRENGRREPAMCEKKS
jgi:hypothetical protein